MVTHRAFFAAIALMALYACASSAALSSADAADCVTTSCEFRLERSLSRGWVDNGTLTTAAARMPVTLVAPQAIAASATDLYVADVGLGQVLRYDLALDRFSVVPGAAQCATGVGCLLLAGRNQELYALDRSRAELIVLEATGRVQRAPVPVVATMLTGFAHDVRTGDLLVLDASAERVLAISRVGSFLGERALDARVSAGSIASYADGRWWLVDRSSAAIQTVDLRGHVESVPGPLGIRSPGPFVIDDRGRWLMLESDSGTLRLLDQGVVRASITEADGKPRRYGDIAALAFSSGRYFVLDRARAVIEVWRLDERRAP